jgi:hypothetical protein
MLPTPHDPGSTRFSGSATDRGASLREQQSAGASPEGADEPAPSGETPQPGPDLRRVALLLARLAVRQYLKQQEEKND